MFEKGTILNERYRIEKLLAEGGMGRVWLATDIKNDKSVLGSETVVVKELKNECSYHEYELSKFFKEIDALKKIGENSGIAKYLYAGSQSNGSPYLVMEYIEGHTLRSQINQGGIANLERVANILEQLGKIISNVHKLNIYHRDLKPENIMLETKSEKEIVKVIDFGIATIKEKKDDPTQTTSMLGTVNYMASEQIMGKPSASSDIYSIGVIAYEMLTGTLPFNVKGIPEPGNVVRLLELQRQQKCASPSVLRPILTSKANALIIQSLKFDPKERPSDLELFTKELAKSLREPEELQPTEIKPGTIKTVPVLSKILPFFILGILLVTAIFSIRYKIMVTSNPIPSPTITSINTSNPKLTLLMSYYIDLNKAKEGKDNLSKRIAGEQIVFHTGDAIRFHFKAFTKNYFYIINETPTLINNFPKYTILFPYPDENNFLEENQSFFLPEIKEPAFVFTVPQNTKIQPFIEKIWLISSKNKIAFLDDLIQKSTLKKGLDQNEILKLQSLLVPDIVKPFVEKDNVKLRSANPDKAVFLLKLQHVMRELE